LGWIEAQRGQCQRLGWMGWLQQHDAARCAGGQRRTQKPHFADAGLLRELLPSSLEMDKLSL